MMAAEHSQALSENPLPICGSENLFFRSHLKENWENAPQCLTLPRALVPPRGERAPRTLESTNPRPRPWRALREGRALAPDAQPAAPDACAPLPRRRAASWTSRRYRQRKMRAALRSRKGDRMGSFPEAKNSLPICLRKLGWEGSRNPNVQVNA